MQWEYALVKFLIFTNCSNNHSARVRASVFKDRMFPLPMSRRTIVSSVQERKGSQASLLLVLLQASFTLPCRRSGTRQGGVAQQSPVPPSRHPLQALAPHSLRSLSTVRWPAEQTFCTSTPVFSVLPKSSWRLFGGEQCVHCSLSMLYHLMTKFQNHRFEISFVLRLFGMKALR